MDARTDYLITLNLMRVGGYPIGANHLTPNEWMALGVIETERQRHLYAGGIR